jgi:ribonucleoside-diphosphate reductase alpha chain
MMDVRTNMNEYFPKLLRDRYLRKYENTWEEISLRTAVYVGQNEPEKTTKEFYQMIKNKDAIPNSPCLMNAGWFGSKDYKHLLSACFVYDIKDSLNSIMDLAKTIAFTAKYGGGSGFNISPLRPENAQINSTGGTSSGPISFLQIFDSVFETIKQGGRRRGAGMCIMNWDHPDINKFITAKRDTKKLNNFNISVLTDNNTTQEIYMKIAEEAWKTAEPGVLFLENGNKGNPFLETRGPMVATNPCLGGDMLVETTKGKTPIKDLVGKKPMIFCLNENRDLIITKAKNIRQTGIKETVEIVYECGRIVCTPDHRIMMENGSWKEAIDIKPRDKIHTQNKLKPTKVLSIDDSTIEKVYDMEVPKYHNFIANNIVVHNCAEIWGYPNDVCQLMSINLSNMIDSNGIFLKEKYQKTIKKAVRFLDCVIDVNQYPNNKVKESALRDRNIGLGVMGWHDFLIKMGIDYDSKLALRWIDILGNILKTESRLTSQQLAIEKNPFPSINETNINTPRRNAKITSIAPTGSLSLIAECSSGIEPLGDFPTFSKFMLDEIFEVGSKIDCVRVKKIKTATEIDWKWHIRHQAQWQKYIDNAVSKTINLPHEITVEDVYDAFVYAKKLGSKGATIFRQDCYRDGAIKTHKTRCEILSNGEIDCG